MGTRREISGLDVLLQIDPAGGTSYDLIVCLTTNSLERTTSVIDASSKCGPNYLPGVQTIQIPFAFNDVLDTSNGEISEDVLHTLWANKTIITWKFGVLTPAAGDVTYSGSGFISDLKLTAAQNSAYAATATISVQNAITQTITAS